MTPAPTPPRRPAAAPILRAAADRPLTGRRRLSWDDWARHNRQTADCLPLGTPAEALASANGLRPVGRRNG